MKWLCLTVFSLCAASFTLSEAAPAQQSAPTALPIPFMSSFVEGLRADIEYAKVGDESLKLDAFIPKGKGPFPIAVIVHGGGWSGGDKADSISEIFEPLGEANFVWFSINYRLAPKHQWPAGFDDVQTALRWVKKNATEFKGDPQRIALIGYSAGGHLACRAVTQSAKNKDESTKVQAVVALAAPTDLVADMQRRGGLSPSMKNLLGRELLDDEAWRLLGQISPLNEISKGMPPFLLIHGTADQSVLYSQSLNWQKRLQEAQVPCEIITLENAPHAIAQWPKFEARYREKMMEWLRRVLSAK